jgi:hypothetical protein
MRVNRDQPPVLAGYRFAPRSAGVIIGFRGRASFGCHRSPNAEILMPLLTEIAESAGLAAALRAKGPRSAAAAKLWRKRQQLGRRRERRRNPPPSPFSAADSDARQYRELIPAHSFTAPRSPGINHGAPPRDKGAGVSGRAFGTSPTSTALLRECPSQAQWTMPTYRAWSSFAPSRA